MEVKLMRKQCDSLSQESFVAHIVRKYRAYALIDIENKMHRLISLKNDDYFDELYFTELRNLRLFYETASVDELIADFINSVKVRYEEEDMSYAKQAFDLLLSKKQFSSYH